MPPQSTSILLNLLLFSGTVHFAASSCPVLMEGAPEINARHPFFLVDPKSLSDLISEEKIVYQRDCVIKCAGIKECWGIVHDWDLSSCKLYRHFDESYKILTNTHIIGPVGLHKTTTKDYFGGAPGDYDSKNGKRTRIVDSHDYSERIRAAQNVEVIENMTCDEDQGKTLSTSETIPSTTEQSTTVDPTTSTTPIDDTTTTTEESRGLGELLGGGSNATCDKDVCTCPDKQELKVDVGYDWATGLQLMKEEDGWWVVGEEPYQRYLIGDKSISPLVTCLPSNNSYKGPLCPSPVVVRGTYSPSSFKCSSGTTFKNALDRNQVPCDTRSAASCGMGGFSCYHDTFPLIIVFCG